MSEVNRYTGSSTGVSITSRTVSKLPYILTSIGKYIKFAYGESLDTADLNTGLQDNIADELDRLNKLLVGETCVVAEDLAHTALKVSPSTTNGKVKVNPGYFYKEGQRGYISSLLAVSEISMTSNGTVRANIAANATYSIEYKAWLGELSTSTGVSLASVIGSAGAIPPGSITDTRVVVESQQLAVQGDISDTVTPASSALSLRSRHGMLANAIKSVTGLSTWDAKTSVSLYSLSSKFTKYEGTDSAVSEMPRKVNGTGHSHDGTDGQGPKISGVNVTTDFMDAGLSGDHIINGTNLWQALRRIDDSKINVAGTVNAKGAGGRLLDPLVVTKVIDEVTTSGRLLANNRYVRKIANRLMRRSDPVDFSAGRSFGGGSSPSPQSSTRHTVNNPGDPVIVPSPNSTSWTFLPVASPKGGSTGEHTFLELSSTALQSRGGPVQISVNDNGSKYFINPANSAALAREARGGDELFQYVNWSDTTIGSIIYIWRVTRSEVVVDSGYQGTTSSTPDLSKGWKVKSAVEVRRIPTNLLPSIIKKNSSTRSDPVPYNERPYQLNSVSTPSIYDEIPTTSDKRWYYYSYQLVIPPQVSSSYIDRVATLIHTSNREAYNLWMYRYTMPTGTQFAGALTVLQY